MLCVQMFLFCTVPPCSCGTGTPWGTLCGSQLFKCPLRFFGDSLFLGIRNGTSSAAQADFALGSEDNSDCLLSLAWWCHLALPGQQGCDPALSGIPAPAGGIWGCAGMAALAAGCQPVADGTASVTLRAELDMDTHRCWDCCETQGGKACRWLQV